MISDPRDDRANRQQREIPTKGYPPLAYLSVYINWMNESAVNMKKINAGKMISAVVSAVLRKSCRAVSRFPSLIDFLISSNVIDVIAPVTMLINGISIAPRE